MTLAGGDTVTCTYTNTLNPGAITVAKKTTNGFGGPFSFVITNAAGAPVGSIPPVSTTAPDVVTVAGSQPLDPGTYTITETLPPPAPTQSWQPVSAECDQQVLATGPGANTVTVTLASGVAQLCAFTNNDPTGSITLQKTTLGGVGTATFVVEPQSGVNSVPPVRENALSVLSATTTTPGVPATATGADLSKLPLGGYSILELPPAGTPAGTWQSVAFQCSSGVQRSPGIVTGVTLTTASPNATCHFTNQFTAAPPPLLPPNTGARDPRLVVGTFVAGAGALLLGAAVLVPRRRRSAG